MRWEYNAKYRDIFDDNVHRDILIVPHQTNVIKNPGGPPEVTSKVPVMIPDPEDPETDPKKKKYIPKKDSKGKYVYDEVPWTITNEDIIKEKFEYVNSINSGDDLTFSSCESAMFKVTIRNNKTYTYIGDGEEPDDPPDPEEDNSDWLWVPDVPNLQTYEIYDKETGKYLVGEVMAKAVVKLYIYFNGDSSSMIYMGMFIAEEDKIVGDGYEREITCYDFLYTLREMDIFNWYQDLFDGIDINKNEYKEQYINNQTSSEEGSQEKKKTPNYDERFGGRAPKSKWNLKEALQNLFTNLVEMKPVPTQTKGLKRNVAVMGNKEKYQETANNVKEDMENNYSGYGMPIVIDEDILTPGTKSYYPKEQFYSENDEDEADSTYHERYGYMKIWELPILKNKKIIQSGAYSCGKFLEDIGILAGRYPVIRLDKIIDGDYQEDIDYNPYEKCILTFKPIQRDDVDISGIADSQFDNSEIVKGFKWDNHKVEQVKRLMIFKYSDKNEGFIKMSNNLTKEEHELLRKSPESIKTVYITQNALVSYLDISDKNLKENKGTSSGSSSGTTESTDVVYSKKDYQDIIDLFVTKKKENSIIYPAYKNMIYRSYTPYEMSVIADPCRDAGDRVTINFTDKITGEHIKFDSYILERKMTGIQKMMDSYVAKGSTSSVNFSTYQASTSYSNPNGMAYQSLAGITGGSGSDDSTGQTASVVNGFDMGIFCEVIRNIGMRLLDEPSDCEAYFVKGSGESTPAVGGDLYEYDFIAKDIEGEKIQYSVLSGYFDNDKTINPIDVYYPAINEETYEEEMVYDGKYTAHDLDLVWENSEEFPTAHSKYHIFYQGTWYQMYPYRTTYNVDTEIIKGVNYYEVYEWNATEQTAKIVNYSPIYDKLTIDGQEVTMNYGDLILDQSAQGVESQYYPPGLYFQYDNSGFFGGTGSVRTIGDEIHSYYLGKGDLSASGGTKPVEDGDTSNKVIVDNQLILAKDYDRLERVITPDPNYYSEYYLFYNNMWYNIDDRYNVIADVDRLDENPDIIDEYTAKATFPNGSDEPRLFEGTVYDTLTINNVSTNVNLFDVIHATHKNLTYIPGNIWTLTENLNTDNNTYIPIQIRPAVNNGNSVQLKWSDPPNLTDYTPYPCTWEGTVIVRKEDSAPIHRWDGVKIVNCKTRDKYKNTPYEDTTIELNKTYYYGFFPYYTRIDDDDHPIRYYRFTKSLKVSTGSDITNPTIDSIELETASTTRKSRAVSAKKKNNAIVTYTIPKLDTGEYTECKLLIKKDTIPDGPSDADKVVDIDPNETTVTVKKLNAKSHYYFVVYLYTDQDQESESEYKDIDTIEDETEWDFDYTGEIQEWTAPETGIYSLETWGAQGGSVSDNISDLYARGGFGAYAYGEVYLNEGDKLYINVGGQNGYGGGGMHLSEISFENFARTLNFSSSNCKSTSGSLGNPGLEQYYNTDYPLVWYGDNSSLLNYLPTYSDGEITSQQISNCFGYILIPINRDGKKITGIKFKYKTTRQVSGSTYCYVALTSNGIDDSGNFNLMTIRNSYELPTSYTDFTMTLSDGGGVCNYFTFSMEEKFAICFKNIVFICED